jgi:hypothetical protein
MDHFKYIISFIAGGILVLMGTIAGCEIRDQKFIYKKEKRIRGVGGNTESVEEEIIKNPQYFEKGE